ncbi:PTS sugar transporter subunit IIA [Paenibacillus sp. GCM10012306]|uniref:PTS sugar transporter subunit IIA n=1 Tax=Paenibacillus sp. GCM10012306 TaxID=3317342 RepID=UPI003608D038
MLSQFLKNNTKFLQSVPSWEESIQIAAQPLLDQGAITTAYVQAMIDNVDKNGPYIVIVPGIAMPHAKNTGNINATGMSFLKLETPVIFPEGKEVSILFVLAAEDSTGHLELITDLSSMLIDEDVMVKLLQVSSETELISLIEEVE